MKKIVKQQEISFSRSNRIEPNGTRLGEGKELKVQIIKIKQNIDMKNKISIDPIALAFVSVLLCAVFYYTFYYAVVPNIIERRLKDLNFMQYSGEKFIGKDSVNVNEYDFYYIQYGNLDGY